MEKSMNIPVTPKQNEFINSRAFETLFGGAAGGGKSYGQLVDALMYAANKYPGSKQLILRRTFPELEKSLIRAALELYPALICNYNQTSHSYKFANGSVIDFGFCDAENDVYKYQSAEYDVIRFDELTHFTESMYLYLISRCRGANGYPKMIKSSTNPGGVGHVWVKSRFIDPVLPGEVYEKDGPARTRVFIPAFIDDNHFLTEADPDYKTRLEMLPEKDRKALLEGRWDIFEGQYFSMWEPKVHVVRPFQLPGHWRRYACMDYGLDMLAAYWIAVNEAGKSYVYREVYEPGLVVGKAVEAVYRAGFGERLTAFFAPPDLFKRHSDTGKTTAEYFHAAGIPLVMSRNNRIPGWYSLAEYLQPYEKEDGGLDAKLAVWENCKNLIRCLPSLQHSQKDPNDCANTPHEITHAPDALRYYVTERPMRAHRLEEAEEYEPEDCSGQVGNFLKWGCAF